MPTSMPVQPQTPTPSAAGSSPPAYTEFVWHTLPPLMPGGSLLFLEHSANLRCVGSLYFHAVWHQTTPRRGLMVCSRPLPSSGEPSHIAVLNAKPTAGVV